MGLKFGGLQFYHLKKMVSGTLQVEDVKMPFSTFQVVEKNGVVKI